MPKVIILGGGVAGMTPAHDLSERGFSVEIYEHHARRTVNSIINGSGVIAPLCEMWNLSKPLLLAPFGMHDEKLYKPGLPWELYEPIWVQTGMKVVEFFEHFFHK